MKRASSSSSWWAVEPRKWQVGSRLESFMHCSWLMPCACACASPPLPGMQVVALDYCHRCGIVSRDLKPEASTGTDCGAIL